MLNIYGAIMISAAFINAISQVLLKKSADDTKEKNFLEKLLNKKVFLAYVLFGIVFLINLYAYRGVHFKYGGAIQSIGQVFVLMLSVLFCNEKLTKNRIVGNLFIICGVVIYSLR
ncbi:MAG: EamA family transporter [Lachnospiraceae bacterium]|nr:EamA family transporter [Lachnospiraceae bacterium]